MTKFKAFENLAEQISEHISNQIIQMDYKSGERILETKLAEELGISRGPIREALFILEKKMLVELIPRKGAKVTEITEDFINNLYDILIEFFALLVMK